MSDAVPGDQRPASAPSPADGSMPVGRPAAGPRGASGSGLHLGDGGSAGGPGDADRTSDAPASAGPGPAGHSHGGPGQRGHGHTHAHGGDAVDGGAEVQMEIDWEALADFLEQGADLRRSVNDGAAGWLRDLTTATRAETSGTVSSAGARPAVGEVGDVVRLIIDVGSGPGVMSTVFAGMFPAATVIAADGAPGLLDRARARAERAGVADRVGTLLVDLPDGFDELALAGPADIVWAGAALHHLGDQTDALRQLGGLLRPGGLVAVLEGGLQTRFLPRDIGFGRPGLQSRLDAVMEDWFAEMRASLPGARPEVEDWPAMFAAAGLRHVGTRSFLVDVPPPGDKALREHVRVDLARLRDLIGDRLDPADVDTVDRLLDAADPAGLLRRTDVFLLTARTVHVGRRGPATVDEP